MTRPVAISGATCGRLLGDIFVRQTVKAVAAHALGVEALRNRIVIGERIVAAMKSRIEAGDLRKARKAGEKERIGARLFGW